MISDTDYKTSSFAAKESTLKFTSTRRYVPRKKHASAGKKIIQEQCLK